ncbi:MAG: PAS domain S-box protein, partial [Deltaproteobacteria bacterium]|nr:PAS domain S-box protein [Deltaproteobacteria bacterium]
ARLIQELLAEGGGARFQLECVDRLSAGLEYLVSNDIGAVLLDIGLPDSQGFDTFARTYAQAPRVPIIVLSGLTDEQLAIKTVQEGAQDYLVKGHVDSHALVRTIRYAIERKQAEEKLRGQALIFENIHDGIIVTDLEGNIIHWNPAAKMIFGYYQDEVLKKALGILSTRLIKGKLRDGRWTGEMNFTRKDETEGICETTVIPLCDEQNNITAFFGVSRDITERKQAEEALRESETRFRTLFEGIPDTVLVHDHEGTILHINEIGAQKLEWSAKDLVGKNLRDIVTPENRASIADHIGETLKVGWCRFETTCVSRSGWTIEVEVNDRPIKFGEKKAILRVARDITERKRAKQELQRSYDKLRETLITMINTLASTVEMRDLYTADHQRRTTILACAIAEEMGLTEEQFDGLRMAGLIHDIGKLSVPAEILNKPGSLSETEFNIIKTHPQAGYNTLKQIEFPWPVAQIVLQHHERLDGSGYPQGLRGEEIMLEARILAVADVVEAMASHRPFRPALGIEAALEEITKNRDILYDPDVTDICQGLFTEKGFAFE